MSTPYESIDDEYSSMESVASDNDLESAISDNDSLSYSGSDGDVEAVEQPIERGYHITMQHVRDAVVGYLRGFVPPPFKWYKYVTWITLRNDVIAALTIVCTLIPSAVAYAEVAGLTAEYGFYSAGVPALVYALLGTSHCAAIGPGGLSSLVSGAAVASLNFTDPNAYATASVALSCLSGIIQLAAGLLRMGVVLRFLSHPVMSGFTTAAGVTIAVQQLPNVFGVSIATQPTVFQTIYQVCLQLPSANVPAVYVSAICLVFLLVMRMLKRRLSYKLIKSFPDQLFLMVTGILVSYYANLSALGTPIVGTLPPTFPLPTVPDSTYMGPLFVNAILLSLVGFAESISAATSFDSAIYKADCPLDGTQELFAHGVAKIVGAFFSGFVVTAGLSRTAAAYAVGASTPIYGFIVGVIAILSGFGAGLLSPLPKAVLACNIIVSCIGLLKFDVMIRLWRLDKLDFFVMLVTIIITFSAGISLALLISVGVSMVLVVIQSSRAHSALLGVLPGSTHVFRNVRRFGRARCVPHVAILRYDASLFFGNCDHFRDKVFKTVDQTIDARAIVLDFSPVNSIDTTALDMVVATMKRLETRVPRVRVVFAGVKHHVREKFDRVGVSSVDPRRFQATNRGALLRLTADGVLLRDDLRAASSRLARSASDRNSPRRSLRDREELPSPWSS